MNITRFVPEVKDKSVLLSQVKPGDTFRFATDTFEEALKTDSFYMKLESPELKGRVHAVNLKDGKRIERDDTHRVVIHEVTLSIVP